MTCTKLTFTTYSEAQHVVNLANNKRRAWVDGRRMNRRQTYKPKRVYKCDCCEQYHITSKKKRK